MTPGPVTSLTLLHCLCELAAAYQQYTGYARVPDLERYWYFLAVCRAKAIPC